MYPVKSSGAGSGLGSTGFVPPPNRPDIKVMIDVKNAMIFWKKPCMVEPLFILMLIELYHLAKYFARFMTVLFFVK